jgi:hypothetical protein
MNIFQIKYPYTKNSFLSRPSRVSIFHCLWQYRCNVRRLVFNKKGKNITVFAVTNCHNIKAHWKQGKIPSLVLDEVERSACPLSPYGIVRYTFDNSPVCTGFKASLDVKRNIVSFTETELQLSNHLDNEQCLSRYVIAYNTF